MSEALIHRPIETKVKWYCPEKGYGFLLENKGSKEIFLHFSVLDQIGWQSLREGNYLRLCEVVFTNRGWQATRIVCIKILSSGGNPSLLIPTFEGGKVCF